MIYLVLDDDVDVLRAAVATLRADDVKVEPFSDPSALGPRALVADAALLDLNFAAGARDGREGLDVLHRLQTIDPALSVVVMTAYGGVAIAVEALKAGAVDFLLKPWGNQTLKSAMASAARLTAERRKGGVFNLDELERRAIERAIAIEEGNLSRAAAILGLTRQALYRRMERHGL